MKILLTGFKPFGKNSSNPTLKLIEELKKRRKENIDTLNLEVVYGLDGEKAVERIRDTQPNLVLSFGLAGGREAVCLETRAVNSRDSHMRDNQGQIFTNEKISDGPLFYETNLNVEHLQKSINLRNFMISTSAGTYVCNDVYYQELDYIYQNHLNILCGFIHIPYIESNNGLPFLEFEIVYQLVSTIIDLILEEYDV